MLLHSQIIIGMLKAGLHDNTGALTEIGLAGNTVSNEFSLVRRCASTLQILRLHGFNVLFDISGLLVDDYTNKYVTYPNVRYLQIEFFDVENHPTFPNAIPFPNLQTLQLGGAYPFGDDVLFRGSQQSLRSLNINLLSSQFMDILDNHYTSTNNNYRNLKKLEVLNSGLFIRGNNKRYEQLIVGIGRYTRDVDLRFCGEENSLKMVSFKSSSLYSIQVLHISNIWFTLKDVIELVKGLPHLVELMCEKMPMGDLPNSMACLGHLVSNYSPLSTNLRVFCMTNRTEQSTVEVIRSLVILAILCPNLHQIKLNSSEELTEFTKKMEQVDNPEDVYKICGRAAICIHLQVNFNIFCLIRIFGICHISNSNYLRLILDIGRHTMNLYFHGCNRDTPTAVVTTSKFNNISELQVLYVGFPLQML